jgi:hypothetical protein
MRPAVIGLALSAVPSAAAFAAPSVPPIGDFVVENGLAEAIFDDGGWRLRRHACCQDRRSGSSGGLLGKLFKPRLGDRDRYYDRRTYGDRDDDVGGSYDEYYDRSLNDLRLDRPRVYQRDSLGGGYFGDPE